jgi:hypothetical protein
MAGNTAWLNSVVKSSVNLGNKTIQELVDEAATHIKSGDHTSGNYVLGKAVDRGVEIFVTNGDRTRSEVIDGIENMMKKQHGIVVAL